MTRTALRSAAVAALTALAAVAAIDVWLRSTEIDVGGA